MYELGPGTSYSTKFPCLALAAPLAGIAHPGNETVCAGQYHVAKPIRSGGQSRMVGRVTQEPPSSEKDAAPLLEA